MIPVNSRCCVLIISSTLSHLRKMEECIEMEGNVLVEDKYLVAKYSDENIKYISDTIKIFDTNPCN